jgi:hypothetical protein
LRLFYVPQIASRNGAGTIDQDIALSTGLSEGAGFIASAEIGGVDGNGYTEARFDRLLCFAQDCFVSCSEMKGAAFGGQYFSARSSDTLGTAGDERNHAPEMQIH